MGKIYFDLSQFTKEVNLNATGVYMITHTNSDLKYVGSTTKSFRYRWRGHLTGIKRGIANKGLINLCKKHGIEGLRFQILEVLEPKESIIRRRERYWIDYYDTYKHGANETLDTFRPLNGIEKKSYTEEEKYQIMMNSPTKKTVYVYNTKGELAYIFPSSSACDRYFGLKKKTTNWAINHPIRSICNKRFYPTYEYKEHWDIKKEIAYKRKQAADITATIRKQKGSYKISESQKIKERMSNPKRLEVKLETKDGELVKVFSSLNECDDYLGMTRGSTSKVLKDKAKTLRRKYIPILI